jgi:hypothetical protein
MRKLLDVKDASSTKLALIVIAVYGLIFTITFLAW